MFEQAEVEGFFQSGYKLGVGLTLYQELPHLQELDARLLRLAVVKELINRDRPGWDWEALPVPVNTGWKELEGEPRAAAPHRV